MVCVILAAGKNLRLNAGGPKSSLKINNQTLLERHIDQFSRIGVTDFAVITGYHRASLEEAVTEIKKKTSVNIKTIYNAKFELENGYSLYTSKEFIKELNCKEFFFTMADHYYEAAFLDDIVKKLEFKNGETLKLAVDLPAEHNKHIDLEDVTKVVADEYIISIGKELTTYNYFDTGLFYVKSDVFNTLDLIAKDSKLSISNMVTQLVSENKARVVEVIGYYWNDIDTPEDFASSRGFLE